MSLQSPESVSTDPLSDLVHLLAEEVAVGVKVLVLELTLPHQLVRDLALQVHEEL